MKKILFILLTTIYATGSLADQPKQWQLGFQDSASQSMTEIVIFHKNILLPSSLFSFKQ
jgi:cytochrome c oxidase subunit 2